MNLLRVAFPVVLFAAFMVAGPAASRFEPQCGAIRCGAVRRGEGLQAPINVIFAIHIEPFLPEFGYDYGERRTELYWLRDLALNHSAKLTAASNGEFMEWVQDFGDEDLIQSYLDAGFNWGTHIHPLWRNGSHDWVLVPPDAPEETVRLIWETNIQAVDNVIGRENNYGLAPYQTHQPLMVQLFEEFDFHIMTMLTEPAGVMAYENLGHYPWNPFRPSANPGKYLKEDLNQRQYVMIPHYPQLEPNPGPTGPRSLGTNKKYFLMEYLEWLHHQRLGLPARVWVFGIATHDCYNAPNRGYIAAMLDWLDENFVGKTTPDGHVIAEYTTATEVAEEFLQWEAEHPGQSSFSWEPGEPYPYTYHEMPSLLSNAEYNVSIDLGESLSCHKLIRNDTTPIYVVWSWSGTQIVDFSPLIEGQLLVHNGRGSHYLSDSKSLVVTEEPLFVEAAPPTIGLPIPSFPLTSILAGLLGAVFATLIVKRRRKQTPKIRSHQ